MSILIMSSNAPSSRGLSPSWTSWKRRNSKSPAQEDVVSNPGGLLVPKPASRSSDSDESRSMRSIRSTSSRGRNLFREIGNRLRSSSNVSIENVPLQEKQFEQVDGWKSGFDKYNQFVTNQVSRDQKLLQDQFPKACKILTKKCDGKFVHGLPEALFDLALLWCPAERILRKEGSTEPSWSWTEWKGPVNFPFDPISCPDTRGTTGDYFRSEIPTFHVGPESAPYTIRQHKGKDVRIQYHPHFKPPRGDKLPSEESDTLRFQAFTIPADGFTVEQLKTEDDDKEIPCSELMCEYQGQKRQCGVLMDYEDHISKPDETPSVFEFILLSRNRRFEPIPHSKRPAATTAHPPGTPVWNGERFLWNTQVVEYDEAVFQDGPNPEWNVLNIMLIQRFKDGFANRVAIGRIHEEAWKARNPTRKDIVLR